jgi:hypothetical protein
MRIKFIAFVLILFSGCKTIDIVEFYDDKYSPQELEEEMNLPPLELEIRMNHGDYFQYINSDRENRSEYIVNREIGVVNHDDKKKLDVLNSHFERLFYVQSADQILPSKNTNTKGKLVVDISEVNIIHDTGTIGSGWALMTLGMGPLILPFKIDEILVGAKIDVSITDDENNLIRSYSARGKGDEYPIAYYWGYNFLSANRGSFLDAYFRALQKIKKQIREDQNYLTDALLYGKDELLASNTEIKEGITEDTVYIDHSIPASSSEQSNTYAVIIGNEDYKSYQTGLTKEQNVPFAINDARVFKKYCNKTLGIPSENIIYLENAGLVRMRQALNQINAVIKNSKGNSDIIFYYAGHGYPDQESKNPYLIPVDVSGHNLEMAIQLDKVYNKLTEYPSNRVIVFLDACFTGGARQMGLTAARSVRIEPKKGNLDGNIVVYRAASQTQPALSYAQKKHGIFTYYLLKN